MPETRRAGGYLHELTADDREELVERVLELQGVAIISGYDHELYAPLVERGGFDRHEHGIWSTAARGVKGNPRDRRNEVIWASPRAASPTLFNHAEARA